MPQCYPSPGAPSHRSRGLRKAAYLQGCGLGPFLPHLLLEIVLESLLVRLNRTVPIPDAVLADPDFLGHLADEAEIVGDKNHATGEIIYGFRQAVNAFHIQVVGGL